MKRFKFRLESVEKVRKRSEDEAMRVLAEARRRLFELVKKGESLHAALNEALIRRENLGSEPISPSVFKVEQDFIAGTKLRIAQLANQVGKAQKGVEKATRFFIHARKQLQVIETIKERELEAFKKEQQKLDQKRMDEMVVMRAGRQHMEDAT